MQPSLFLGLHGFPTALNSELKRTQDIANLVDVLSIPHPLPIFDKVPKKIWVPHISPCVAKTTYCFTFTPTHMYVDIIMYLYMYQKYAYVYVSPVKNHTYKIHTVYTYTYYIYIYIHCSICLLILNLFICYTPLLGILEGPGFAARPQLEQGPARLCARARGSLDDAGWHGEPW